MIKRCEGLNVDAPAKLRVWRGTAECDSGWPGCCLESREGRRIQSSVTLLGAWPTSKGAIPKPKRKPSLFYGRVSGFMCIYTALNLSCVLIISHWRQYILQNPTMCQDWAMGLRLEAYKFKVKYIPERRTLHTCCRVWYKRNLMTSHQSRKLPRNMCDALLRMRHLKLWRREKLSLHQGKMKNCANYVRSWKLGGGMNTNDIFLQVEFIVSFESLFWEEQ